MAAVDDSPPRRRAARLGWLSVALMGVSLVFLAAAAWVALRGHATDIVGHFLLGANDNIPTVTAILAAVAAAVAFCLGLAALNAAARMRVLARDRRIPAPLSPGMRRARDLLLTPLGPATVRLVKDPDLPPGKLPTMTHPRRSCASPFSFPRTTRGSPSRLRSRRCGPRPGNRTGWSWLPTTAPTTRPTSRAKRGGGLHHRRQHREEGRRAEPGAFRDVCRRRGAGRRDDHGRGLHRRPRVSGDGHGATRGRSRADRGGRRVLWRGRQRPGRSAPAQRVHPVPATSPAVTERCSCSPVPRRCFGRTPSRRSPTPAGPSFPVSLVSSTTPWR